MIVGAPELNNRGRAYVYLGSALGLQASPQWTADGEQIGDEFASSVAGAGDVNADGFDDVIVCAQDVDNGGEGAESRAYVYHGSATGPSLTAVWTVESDDTFSGDCQVATAGDVNADGFDDVAVGFDLVDGVLSGQGQVRIYLGSATGLQSDEIWTATIDTSLPTVRQGLDCRRRQRQWLQRPDRWRLRLRQRRGHRRRGVPLPWRSRPVARGRGHGGGVHPQLYGRHDPAPVRRPPRRLRREPRADRRRRLQRPPGSGHGLHRRPDDRLGGGWGCRLRSGFHDDPDRRHRHHGVRGRRGAARDGDEQLGGRHVLRLEYSHRTPALLRSRGERDRRGRGPPGRLLRADARDRKQRHEGT